MWGNLKSKFVAHGTKPWNSGEGRWNQKNIQPPSKKTYSATCLDFDLACVVLKSTATLVSTLLPISLEIEKNVSQKWFPLWTSFKDHYILTFDRDIKSSLPFYGGGGKSTMVFFSNICVNFWDWHCWQYLITSVNYNHFWPLNAHSHKTWHIVSF